MPENRTTAKLRPWTSLSLTAVLTELMAKRLAVLNVSPVTMKPSAISKWTKTIAPYHIQAPAAAQKIGVHMRARYNIVWKRWTGGYVSNGLVLGSMIAL